VKGVSQGGLRERRKEGGDAREKEGRLSRRGIGVEVIVRERAGNIVDWKRRLDINKIAISQGFVTGSA